VLVETPVAETAAGGGFPQMMAAENYVVEHNLGDVISQSFSLPEQNFPSRAFVSRLRYAYVNAALHHIAVLAATNDNGVSGVTRRGRFWTERVTQWPATDPLVTAVGGTTRHLNAGGSRTSPDTVWNDTSDPSVSALFGRRPPLPWAGSGGVSRFFARPAFQGSVRRLTGGRRGVPDISMSASLSGGVLGFSTYTGKAAWGTEGGTSAATPEFAGIVAIADQYVRQRLHKGRLGPINAALYLLEHRHAPGIVDVTAGNNTVSFPVTATKIVTVRGYPATRGYDLASGIGTVDAARFVPELARAG
jgi:subtilase family serine protease